MRAVAGECPGMSSPTRRRSGQGPLASVSLDNLAEIALLVEQPDSDYRYAEVAGGLELIAGDVAESARVNRQRLAQPKLHTEVSGADQGRVALGVLKPGRTLQSLPLAFCKFAHPIAEVAVFLQRLEFCAGSRLQNHPQRSEVFEPWLKPA